LPPVPPLPPLPSPRADAPHDGGASLPLAPRHPGGTNLERSRQDPVVAFAPASESPPSRAERLAAEQERRDADARSSPLLAIGQGGGMTSTTRPRPERGLPEQVQAPAAHDQVTAAAPRSSVPQAPATRPAPGGPVVLEGTVIPAVLLTEINSELPGTLVAMVTQDIWDSVHGRHLLIPRGARLVGDYNSDVRPGQERVLAAFRRLIFPDGSSLDLLGTQATDAQGRSGLHDRVDHHFWDMFGASFIVAGLASLVQRRESQPSTVVVVPGNAPGASSALASAAGTVLVETSRAILGRTRNLPPTLVIRQGHRFSLTVQKNVLLDPHDAGTIAMFSR
jgi:type IV secretion system protein VirB10